MCTAIWNHPNGYPVKCGQCVECRLAYSREWAIRITHEAQMRGSSCMLNLTYDDAHLPKFGQLVKSDLQKFFKRLRKNTGPFRYVAAGEYGDLRRRPHFHIALFGMDFAGSRHEWGQSINGDPTYISPEVSKSWSLGGHVIGSLNFESAAYISRYIMKKLKGDSCSPLPLACDPETGELVMPNPEFMVCSKGIGKLWFQDFFMSDVFPHASVVTAQGSRAPVPRYYKALLKELGADLAFDMSARSATRFAESQDLAEQFPARRASRAVYNKARTSLFSRDTKE